jgi:hypothetical protein
VREARGTLRGRGAAHAGLFLSLIALALPLLHVKPRLAEIDVRMGEARGVARQVVEDLRKGRFAEARSAFAEPLQEQISEASLQSRVERGQMKRPDHWKRLRPSRTRLAGTTARVEFDALGIEGALVLAHDGRWKVSEIQPFLDRLGD